MFNLLIDTQSDLSLPVFGLLVAMVMLNTVGVVDILGPLSVVLTIDVFLVGFANATVDCVTWSVFDSSSELVYGETVNIIKY